MKFVAHLKMGFCGFITHFGLFLTLSLGRFHLLPVLCFYDSHWYSFGVIYVYEKYLTSKKTEKKEEGGGEIN